MTVDVMRPATTVVDAVGEVPLEESVVEEAEEKVAKQKCAVHVAAAARKATVEAREGLAAAEAAWRVAG